MANLTALMSKFESAKKIKDEKGEAFKKAQEVMNKTSAEYESATNSLKDVYNELQEALAIEVGISQPGRVRLVG